MSDLSRMLDDVYASPDSGDVATDDFPTDDFANDDFTTRAPEWSSAEALDEAFSAWVPGPADGATALERSMVDESVEMSFVTEPEASTWLDDTEPVAPAPVIAGPRRWSPADDDILPSRRGPRRRRR